MSDRFTTWTSLSGWHRSSPATDAEPRRFLPALMRAPRRLDADRAVEHLPRLYRAARA
jgi:hypothetical protein